MTTNELDWMLWYEEVPKNGFADALKRASEYYRTKYGRWPNRVKLPSTWEEEAAVFRTKLETDGKNGVELETRKTVQARCLLLTFDANHKATV